MTDNEVIKALECCAYWENDKSCEDCPANTYGFSCANRMAKYALNFINRQKAGIERLKKKNKILIKDADTAFQDGLDENRDLFKKEVEPEIRAEAIKEFAGRLKSKVNDLEFRTKTHRKTVPVKFCDDNANWVMHECVPKEIDKIAKEMMEAQE